MHQNNEQGGCVVAVTGASRGLGARLAHGLALAGCRLTLGARDFPALQAVSAELPGDPLRCRLDVRDEDEIDRFASAALARWGRVDVVVNNAGVGVFRRLEEFTPDDYAFVMDTNVRGAWMVARRFLAPLKRSAGMLVMVSSDVSTRVFDRGGIYCASKFALRALCRGLQLENPDLRVLEFRPGAIDTHFGGSAPSSVPPAGRLGADEAAAALLALLRLPRNLRIEEMVVKSRTQTVEF